MDDTDQITTAETETGTVSRARDAADDTRDQLQTVRAERDDYLDALQRSQAEFANFRKRVARDNAVSGERARLAVWQRVLPLIDAIDSARRHDDAVTTLWRVALDVLARDDIERIAPDPGERFDPTTQHAVDSTADPGADVVVASLVRPGYRLGDHVLRAADVDVTARGAAAGSGEGADDGEG